MKKAMFSLVVLVGVAGFAAKLVPELPEEGAKEQLEFYIDAARHGSPRAMLILAHYNEHGIGMVTNRAEALRWYRGILSSPSASPREVVEAAENGLARLGGDTLTVDATSTSGNHYLDFIAAQTNRASALFASRSLRHRLVGRTLVFTNMVASYVQRRKDGGVNLMLDIPQECRPRPPRDPHAYRPYDFSFMTAHVLFDAPNAQLVRFLDRDDRIVRVEGTVVTNCPWRDGLVLAGVSLEPADASLREPLPPFDAATITGDELLDYFKRQRRIRKWQYAEIQSRLDGRRLAFHKLRLSGSSGSKGGKFDSTFWIEAVPHWEEVGEGNVVGSATFKLSFPTDSARSFARHLVDAGGFSFLEEVVGTFVKVEDPDDGWALQLKDVSLVPKGVGLDIAGDGKGPLPGDEIVRQVGQRFTSIAKLYLCSRFAGREVSFTSGVVASCRTDWVSSAMTVVCRMTPQNPDNGRQCPLQVSFTVPAEKARTLRRTPIPGDLVVGLKGRVPGLPPVDEKAVRRGRSGSSTLELEQAEFSITWKSDVAKTTGLETKTGERIVRRLALCWQEVRQDQFLRLARQVDGKAVDFPGAKIHNVYAKGDGTVLVMVGLEDVLFGECAELALVVPPGKLAEQVANMKYGVRIRKIHGVLKAELAKPNDWDAEIMCVRLKDATFEIIPSAKPRR